MCAYKGSCFIEFAKIEGMLKATTESNVASTNADGTATSTVTIQYKDTPLLCVMPFTEWLRRKTDKKGPNTATKSNTSDATGKRKADDEAEEEKEKPSHPVNDEYTKNVILKVTNVPVEAKYTLYQLKDLFKAKGSVKYVDHTEGETIAYIRVADEEAATAIQTAVTNNELVFKTESNDNIKVELNLLQGEEEATYWAKIIAASGSSQNKRGSGGRGGRGGGRGGNKRRRY